jgi:hypothetical protein
MDAKLAAYSARKIVEVFIRDPNVSPQVRQLLTELLAADISTFHHSKVSAQIRLMADGYEHLEGGIDVDFVTVNDATGRRRILILV